MNGSGGISLAASLNGRKVGFPETGLWPAAECSDCPVLFLPAGGLDKRVMLVYS